jgi:6-phosphogluconolactonase
MRSMMFLFLALLFSICGFSQNYYMFVGTYTNGKSEGIYVYRFNAATGDAQPVSVIASTNPSYLSISPNGKYLYSVNEIDGNQPGEVTAYMFDKTNGKLTFLNKQLSGGISPCYVSESKNSKWLMVANYTSGSIAALPVNVDGSVGSLAEVIQHEGKGTDTSRQEKPHAHSAIFSPDEHYLLCADLGIDKEMIYRFNSNLAKPLVLEKDSAVSIQPGSGPRHIAFHPTKPYLYIIEELSGTVDAFQYNNGKLKHMQRISSLAADFKGDAGSADIHISPNGKFLYATNRGTANNIAIFSIDTATGKLHVKGFQDVLGKHPRNFIIEPSGRFLLVANRDTDNIVVFKIDSQTGLLKDTGKQIQIPNPVCLKLLKE